MDKTSMTLGLMLGQRIAGQRTKKKTLVGYMYNDAGPFPALPEEWDKQAYPCVYITGPHNSLFKNIAYVTSIPLRYYPAEEVMRSADGSIFSYKSIIMTEDNAGEDYWFFNPHDAGDDYDLPMTIDKLFWSNYDILNEDGTLYLAASDPIPVYA